VDVDVLDQSIMFAVDDPQPDGLSWTELRTALRMAVESNGAVGLQVTLYNPDMEADGASGRGLAATLVKALGSGHGP
jgi:arginase